MLVGHQKQWQFFKKSVEIGRISHAYLFSGQVNLGKKTFALEFIKLLNCQDQNPRVRPCQNCRSCQDIQKLQHPDLNLISPIGKEIQISQIRDLIWKLSLRPYSAPFKVAILDEAHSMNQEAQSCFLKTLEEPKGNTLLILITEYPEMLLPTILSRCEKIKFYPVKKTEIENHLRALGASVEEAKKLSEISLGRPGLAINFFLDSQKLENHKTFIRDLLKILNSDLSTRFQFAKNLSNQDLKEILNIWLEYLRNILLRKIKGFPELRDYSLSKLKDILRLIEKTIFLISTTNVNQKLALEVLMLEL